MVFEQCLRITDEHMNQSIPTCVMTCAFCVKDIATFALFENERLLGDFHLWPNNKRCLGDHKKEILSIGIFFSK